MLTRETSSVMRFLSAESCGAALSLFFACGLFLACSGDWPESRSDRRQRATTGYSFFMGGESIIGGILRKSTLRHIVGPAPGGGAAICSTVNCGTLVKIGVAL